MGRLKLFSDDGDDSPSPDDNFSKIEINEEFAKRYEHNKKREELQRYEELKKQGRVGSDSEETESEYDADELVNPNKKKDFKFFDALLKVKNQDPILQNKDAKLFDTDENDNDDNVGNVKNDKTKKKKAMYLKDVVSKQLIEAGPEFDDDDDDEEEDETENVGNKVKSYSEEQEDIRKELLKAVELEGNDDDQDDFFKAKSKDEEEEEEEEEEDEVGVKMNEYFGDDEKLDEDTKFLKDYFRNRMWIDDGKGKSVDDGIAFSEDEEEIEKQEDYEREYNFRFEENAGDRVMGHSRRIEGSVRKKENARKSQRERKEERLAQAEFERKEELKRMKNLKRKEISDKLEKIKEAAGIGKDVNVLLDVDDLEEEFDPDEYDRKMRDAFGDGYYDAEDADPKFGSDDDEEDADGMEKPDFDKEDELLGLDKGLGDGFFSTREKILKSRVNGGDSDDEVNEVERKRKREPSEVEKAVRDELMDEYYKLDYEDTIGDLKTRFKYRPVKAKRYGLKTEEIFAMDDKDLNQYVSLKKIAPYREKEWEVPRIKTVQLKQKVKGSEKGETSGYVGKKRRSDGEVAGEVENRGTSDLSKKSKRRRRNADLKLSRSRLIAYGKIPSKAKSNKKR